MADYTIEIPKETPSIYLDLDHLSTIFMDIIGRRTEKHLITTQSRLTPSEPITLWKISDDLQASASVELENYDRVLVFSLDPRDNYKLRATTTSYCPVSIDELTTELLEQLK